MTKEILNLESGKGDEYNLQTTYKLPINHLQTTSNGLSYSDDRKSIDKLYNLFIKKDSGLIK